MLTRDQRAFDAFVDGLLSLDDEKLKARFSKFSDEEYWKQFVYLLHEKKHSLQTNNQGELALDASLKIKEFTLKHSSANIQGISSITRPLVLLVSQYVLGTYGEYSVKKNIKNLTKIEYVLKMIGRVIFDDENALLKYLVFDNLKNEFKI